MRAVNAFRAGSVVQPGKLSGSAIGIYLVDESRSCRDVNLGRTNLVMYPSQVFDSAYNCTSKISSHPGWVSQSNQRGTLDIIWSCTSTIFVSLWLMLHLNVPAGHEGFWPLFFRKTRWFVLGALAPETVLLASGGQWESAKRSVRDMKDLGFDHWTLVHGFYADSGGFLLHTLDHGPFPVTAKQIHYLIKHKYMKAPEISEKEIFDKSKADTFAKTIACVQTGRFVTQCIARVVQKLPISPLEQTTGAIILCTSGVFVFWLRKPLNVQTSTILVVEHSSAKILCEAGARARITFWNTPMDFIEPPNIYTFGNWPTIARHFAAYKKPFARIPNDRNPQLYGLSQRIVYSILVIVFSTLSFAEWHFEFPSQVERITWRTACIVAESSLLVHAITEALSHHAPPHDYLYIEGYILRWPDSLLFFVPATTYFMARIALIILAIMSLRSLPAESYLNVEWPMFIPHF